MSAPGARTSILADGAAVVESFITETEEDAIIEAIAAASWSNDFARRVQHYGHRYDYTKRTANKTEPAPPLPEWAQTLAERLEPQFGAIPVQCIVNEYRPGQGIGMHSDAAAFGPVVASISLADSWPMQMRRHDAGPYARGGLPSDEIVMLPRRSALVLTGRARRVWMHGLCPKRTRTMRRTRVSATFRTLATASR